MVHVISMRGIVSHWPNDRATMQKSVSGCTGPDDKHHRVQNR